MKQPKICKILKKSSSWVSKWCRATEFFDSPRSGRPVTALTPENLETLDRVKEKSVKAIVSLVQNLVYQSHQLPGVLRNCTCTHIDGGSSQECVQNMSNNVTLCQKSCVTRGRVLGKVFGFGRKNLDYSRILQSAE